MYICNTTTMDLILLVGIFNSEEPNYEIKLKKGSSYEFNEDFFNKVAITNLKKGQMVSNDKIKQL